jgi:hypothetical protein
LTAFDDALVTVLLADYIGVDPSGKFNLIGQGFQVTAVQPTGTTPPQFVAAIVDLPSRYAGRQVSLSLELIDLTENGSVKLSGPSGRAEALRAEQLFTVNPSVIAVPGLVAPPELSCRLQMIMGFTNGLPLVPGRRYEWRVMVDGQRRKGWVARFDVLQQVPPPIIGGQGGPSDIPNIHVDPVTDDDEVVDGDAP